ncbi:hypothetical protein ACFSM5_11195 [Lacibacterium aquatile]|uniref:Uncharacterized protein n=1 Tax=Lacibacterium aquatile TaxID=1168082 RepID=A0ABW5DW26_9PROT
MLFDPPVRLITSAPINVNLTDLTFFLRLDRADDGAFSPVQVGAVRLNDPLPLDILVEDLRVNDCGTPTSRSILCRSNHGSPSSRQLEFETHERALVGGNCDSANIELSEARAEKLMVKRVPLALRPIFRPSLGIAILCLEWLRFSGQISRGALDLTFERIRTSMPQLKLDVGAMLALLRDDPIH